MPSREDLPKPKSRRLRSVKRRMAIQLEPWLKVIPCDAEEGANNGISWKVKRQITVAVRAHQKEWDVRAARQIVFLICVTYGIERGQNDHPETKKMSFRIQFDSRFVPELPESAHIQTEYVAVSLGQISKC